MIKHVVMWKFKDFIGKTAAKRVLVDYEK